MPQFAEARTCRFDWNDLAVGLGLFSMGLFKQGVIADALSGQAGKLLFLTLLVSLLAFSSVILT